MAFGLSLPSLYSSCHFVHSRPVRVSSQRCLLCCNVLTLVCVVCVCVSLCVTGSCRKLGWLTLMATRCLTLRYNCTHTHTHTCCVHIHVNTGFNWGNRNRQQNSPKTRWVTMTERKPKRPKRETHEEESEGRSIRGSTCVQYHSIQYMCTLCSPEKGHVFTISWF